jgi:hypothetical protein
MARGYHSQDKWLTVFHIVDGGEMLDPAAHHAALPPQLGALGGRQ